MHEGQAGMSSPFGGSGKGEQVPRFQPVWRLGEGGPRLGLECTATQIRRAWEAEKDVLGFRRGRAPNGLKKGSKNDAK